MALTMSRGWARVFFVLCFIVATCSALRFDPISFTVEDSSSQQMFQSKWEYLKPILTRPFLRDVPTRELVDCKELYGIFPCSTSLGGNLFLLAVFVYILLKAAQLLSSGSELLLTVLDPGLIGGLLLPILGAVPDAFLILVSGLSASAAEAQSEVLVGIGLLAGSNIMILTLLWGGSLLLGRCDLVCERGVLEAKEKTLERKWWNLTGTGVTTDQQTRVASWIMSMTVLPYLVAQAPVAFGWSDDTGSVFVLFACAISLLGLASYCAYQVLYPWIQHRCIYRAKANLQRSSVLYRFSQLSSEKSWGSLLETDGVTPNRRVLGRIFQHFDTDEDNHLSEHELKVLISSLGMEHEGYIPKEDELKTWLAHFDMANDRKVSKDEFVKGMVKWIHTLLHQPKVPKRNYSKLSRIEAEAAAPAASNGVGEPGPRMFWRRHIDQARDSLETLLKDKAVDDVVEEEEMTPPSKTSIIVTAVGYLILGTLIAGVVADPLVDAIRNFSSVTGISPFFISFVASPLATDSSEMLSSFIFAMKKKKKNISMTYSQIYGAVTMNNTLCLAIFLAIVYARGLRWDFSSEVLVILVATVVIGALASMRVTFQSWMAIVALLLYPFSIALVAVLNYVYGWE